MEHAAFCLRGREVSTIAVYDAKYKKLVASLEARLVVVLSLESSAVGVSLEGRLEEAELARGWLRGSHGFRMCLGWLSNDVNLLCICRLCDEGLPGAGSRAEAVEHAAFCLRGREVSTIAVYDAEHE